MNFLDSVAIAWAKTTEDDDILVVTNLNVKAYYGSLNYCSNVVNTDNFEDKKTVKHLRPNGRHVVY